MTGDRAQRDHSRLTSDTHRARCWSRTVVIGVHRMEGVFKQADSASCGFLEGDPGTASGSGSDCAVVQGSQICILKPYRFPCILTLARDIAHLKISQRCAKTSTRAIFHLPLRSSSKGTRQAAVMQVAASSSAVRVPCASTRVASSRSTLGNITGLTPVFRTRGTRAAVVVRAEKQQVSAIEVTRDRYPRSGH